jgi:threonine aldolase
MIDLRSDTVTQPTEAMRRAIADAEVGDDVYHDDPTVLALEARVAEILGKEDAMYTPTGTMANQTALRAQTSAGDLILASKDAHIDSHELGAANAIAGLTIHQLDGEAGTFTAAQVRAAVPEIPPSMPSALFQPVTLVAAENTHNASGGAVWPLARLDAVTTAARELGIATHLDGARLWNATAASGVSEEEYAAGFDTVAVCFSKGLGAPMGSALAGKKDVVDRARRFKQMYGGGFRQAGMMAAGALYAVNHHRERLPEDHDNARHLAAGLVDLAGIDVDPSTVATNMVYFRVTTMSAGAFADRWLEQGVAALPLGADTIRAVMHFHITPSDVDAALKAAAAAVNA